MSEPPRFDQSPDWDAVARHRSGESEGDEARRMAEWLAAHPADAEMLARLDTVIAAHVEAGAPSGGDPDVDAALRSVRARMHEQTPAGVLPFPRPRDVPVRRGPARWIAGGLAAAAAIGALAVGLSRDRSADGLPRSVEPGSVTATAVGVRDSVRLPDGTRVVLGPASRLTVSASYGSAARGVSVDGEAFFVVQRMPASSFTVRAGPAVVRDLGTAFTVRTEERDGVRGVTVAVTEGSVELDPDHAPASSVVLKAGDRGIALSDGSVTSRADAGDADLAWTRGRLVFRDAPLTDVRATLRRWYGVELTIADSSLLAHRITATFEGEPVDSVLRVVALALGATVERRDSVAVLRGGAAR